MAQIGFWMWNDFIKAQKVKHKKRIFARPRQEHGAAAQYDRPTAWRGRHEKRNWVRSYREDYIVRKERGLLRASLS